MRYKHIFRQSLPRLLALYVVLVTGVSLLFPALYALMFPGSVAELARLLVNAVTAGFDMEGFKSALPSAIRDDVTVVAFGFLGLHAFAIIVLNMVFPAVIVAKFIRPAVDLRTSRGAVYDPRYGLRQSPHVLFRVVNMSPFALYAVSLRAFLVVHNEDPENPRKDMIYYFPMPEVDPVEIPVLRSRCPWIVAIPVDTGFENSLVQNYQLDVARESGSHPGRRSIEVLISGHELDASATVMESVTISLETGGPDGVLCGAFEPLPTTLGKSQATLINLRHSVPASSSDEDCCAPCRHQPDCRFLAAG